MRKILSGLFLGYFVTLAFADAPVVDYSTDASTGQAKSFPTETVGETAPSSVTTTTSIKTNFSVDQRVNRLEQQVNNINMQNLSHKIEELQQNLQKLNGQVESQVHQIEELNTQLKGFYQDLNRRLGGDAKSTPTTTPSQVTPDVSKTTPASLTTIPNASIVPATASNVAGAFASEVKKKDASQPVDVNTDNAFLKEQQMYQTAIDLLPDKKHESESKLRNYLKQYPKGVYVANAHYWLGEINFLQKNFDAAEEEFKIVIDKYSKSKRVADAMLKLALVHQNQGRDAQAKEELNKVIKKYPGTSAAQLAKQQLAGN